MPLAVVVTEMLGVTDTETFGVDVGDTETLDDGSGDGLSPSGRLGR